VIICQAPFYTLLRDQLIQTSLLEWIGTTTGFICVYLAAKKHILNWPVAIVSVLVYLFIFIQYKLYGDAALQVYFLGTCIYGWYYWSKNKSNHQKPIASLSTSQYLGVIIFTLFLAVLAGLILDKFTDTDVPYMDGTCTAISLVAQILMTRKILQSWILWIVVDILYVPLYLYKNLALTGILYILYLVLATMGYLDWKRTWKKETQY
jgi:nicotinamide mononucleotide transporter